MRRRAGSIRRQRRGADILRLALALYLWIAVDDHFAQVRQQPGRTVPPRRKTEQGRVLIEKPRGDLATLKVRVIDDILEKRNVRLHAADAEFPQGAIHALAGVREP